MLDAMSAPRNPELMPVVLLHDIGKPATRQEEAGRIRFPCHAVHSERIARSVLQRLKSSGDRIQIVSEIIRRHMNIVDVREMWNAVCAGGSVRRSSILNSSLPGWICSAAAGICRSGLSPAIGWPDSAANLFCRILFIRGGDLIAVGLKPGPHFTRILNDLYDRQLEGEFADKDAANLR